MVVDVEVAGPGFDGGLGASASLQVTPGVYDVLANLGITPDAIVSAGYVGTVAGSPATVVANQTQVVSVSYALLGGTGFVWLPSYADGNVYGFSAATLTAGNATPTPDVVLTTDAGSLGQAVAFDRAGTLWTTNSMGQIWGWQLYADGGAADPTVLQTVGTDGGPIFPQSMTFAPNGDLWMVMGNDDALAVVSASQLSQGGAVTLTELPGNSIPLDDGGAFLSLDLPYGVAFDSAGAVWVANIGANNPGNVGTLAKFALTPDGGFDPTPLAFLYSSQGVFNGPNGLSFDAQGNLWVADYAGNAVMRFDVSSASGLVDAQPVATLTTPGGVRAAPFNQPNYVTFDNSGALWLYNQRDSTLERFPDPLGYTGVVTPTPDLALSLGFGGDTGKFQFDLPAPGLGLYP